MMVNPAECLIKMASMVFTTESGHENAIRICSKVHDGNSVFFIIPDNTPKDVREAVVGLFEALMEDFAEEQGIENYKVIKHENPSFEDGNVWK